MNDLTNLIEWTEFAADKKTVSEVLAILNSRHRESVEKLENENTAMREAIREAATAIDRLTTAAAGGMQPANAKLDAIRSGNAALAKLQPFLK